MPPTWATKRTESDTRADAVRSPARRSQGGPAATSGDDPRLAHGGVPAVLALQQTAGNAAVASLVAPPAVQRAVTIDEVSTSVRAADEAPLSPEVQAALPAIVEEVRDELAAGSAGGAGTASGAAAASAGAGAAGQPVTSDGATTTLHGAEVDIDAPLTKAQGVLQADTVIAQNVVGSNYTPGAGNVW